MSQHINITFPAKQSKQVGNYESWYKDYFQSVVNTYFPTQHFDAPKLATISRKFWEDMHKCQQENGGHLIITKGQNAGTKFTCHKTISTNGESERVKKERECVRAWTIENIGSWIEKFGKAFVPPPQIPERIDVETHQVGNTGKMESPIQMFNQVGNGFKQSPPIFPVGSRQQPLSIQPKKSRTLNKSILTEIDEMNSFIDLDEREFDKHLLFESEEVMLSALHDSMGKSINGQSLLPIENLIHHFMQQSNSAEKFVTETQLAVKRQTEEVEAVKVKKHQFDEALKLAMITKEKLISKGIGRKRKLSEFQPDVVIEQLQANSNEISLQLGSQGLAPTGNSVDGTVNEHTVNSIAHN